MKISRIAQFLPPLFSLMMVPSFARGLPAPPAPTPVAANDSGPLDNTDATQAETQPPVQSNVGAVNEGGGSANTNGMNNGLSPNSSGSGTLSSRASDSMGIPFGGTGKKTSGAVAPEDQN